MDEIPLSALLVALIVLLLLSGFFSISETAMMALNRYRVRHLAKSGHRGARRVEGLLARVDRLLGTILLGNNLVNAAAAALVTVIAFRMFGDSELALTLATVVVTFLILVFSEVTPKVIGASHPERIAFPASLVLGPLLRLAHPVVWFINLFVNALLRLLHFKPADGADVSLGAEELRTLVSESASFIPKLHRSMLVNILDLERVTVDDVMTPRHQIETLNLDADPDEILQRLVTSHHTRLPAWRDQPDNIVGLVHVRRVLFHVRDGRVDMEGLVDALTEPYFVPSGTPLFTQLREFQENHRRLALVVDEYGELQGLVSVEDILEEIVGEFTTQAPSAASPYARQPDGSWLVEGGGLIRDINRKLGLKLPLDGPKTLNGLTLDRLEDIPEAGTMMKIAGYPIEIVQVQDRAVRVARIYPRTSLGQAREPPSLHGDGASASSPGAQET